MHRGVYTEGGVDSVECVDEGVGPVDALCGGVGEDCPNAIQWGSEHLPESAPQQEVRTALHCRRRLGQSLHRLRDGDSCPPCPLASVPLHLRTGPAPLSLCLSLSLSVSLSVSPASFPSLITFLFLRSPFQRYKTSLTREQKEKLRNVLRIHTHPALTPLIRNELFKSVSRGDEEGSAPAEMESSSSSSWHDTHME
jgi:hypothetical protein